MPRHELDEQDDDELVDGRPWFGDDELVMDDEGLTDDMAPEDEWDDDLEDVEYVSDSAAEDADADDAGDTRDADEPSEENHRNG